jgi:hypothetical protein
MDLLDRYLQAVKFWLPSAQKQDIIAELSEDIRSQIEDKESALGRTLTQPEVEAILRQLGRPVLVANRYLPQQHLIGPVWFPIYLFVLKIVIACYLVPWIAVWIGLMIFNPAYRAAHFGAGLMGALGHAWGGFWLAAAISTGTVTLVFAVLERCQEKSPFLEKWDPAKLPAVRDPNRIPRGTSILGLVANIVFCSWWITAMWSQVVLDRPDVRITLAPVWRVFLWGFLIGALVNIAEAGVNLLRPYWTRRRAGLRLVTNLFASALFCALCRSEILANISVATVATEKTLEITNAINRGMFQVFPIAVGIGLLTLGVDVYRIVRAKNANEATHPQSTSGVPAGGLPGSAA